MTRRKPIAYAFNLNKWQWRHEYDCALQMIATLTRNNDFLRQRNIELSRENVRLRRAAGETIASAVETEG